MTEHDERNPYERAGELPAVELGDRSSDELEPAGGRPDAPAPELERLDLTADEPGDVELDVELIDDDEAPA